ncbi:alanine--glyoxylate aminotransferase family protein [Microvirgula aerodenitrificans]|uniref:pyridoxal-phosphate-dependent aminotransferase family protein n=1 Tax=Microvirgula aerodenitrificans TaxID=57480 RepID=UPI00248EE046|nr:aminotransferase class V-fold PLP-dependent enzyme [Microvirgula aerodenitrificans]
MPRQALELFIPGPTWLRPETRQAALLPEFGHRDSQAREVVSSIFDNLRAIAELPDDYDIALVNGSGSTGMECALRSLVADDDRLLCVTVGVFGALFHSMAIGNGKQVERLDFEPGCSIDLDVLEHTLRNGRFNVVTLTHNESSTGVVSDIVGACRLIRAHGALPIVDGVSLFGGDHSRIADALPAVYATTTQKCLALPAGQAILFVHRDALDKAAQVSNRGYTSDLLKHVEFGRDRQIMTTPDTTLLNQMQVQLDTIVHAEGVLQRFARHRAMRTTVRDWATARPDRFELFVADADASPSLTTVSIDPALDPAALKAAMRERGYLIDTGHKKLNDILGAQSRRLLIRIPHMGDIGPAMLGRYLDALDSESAALRR